MAKIFKKDADSITVQTERDGELLIVHFYDHNNNLIESLKGKNKKEKKESIIKRFLEKNGYL